MTKVSLFIPCFVRHFAPATSDHLTTLFDRLGIGWDLPPHTTCCGQPNYNAGFFEEAAALAEKFIHDFADAEVVVVPSASCVAMVHKFASIRQLRPEAQTAAAELARRTHEVCSYLVEQANITDVGAEYNARVTYHDACHALRSLQIRDQPRLLLRRVRGLTLLELPSEPECCGFGGTFSVKYPELSASMADAKLAALQQTGSDTLVSTDISCLLHLQARARRLRQRFTGLHVLDILACGARGAAP